MMCENQFGEFDMKISREWHQKVKIGESNNGVGYTNFYNVINSGCEGCFSFEKLLSIVSRKIDCQMEF